MPATAHHHVTFTDCTATKATLHGDLFHRVFCSFVSFPDRDSCDALGASSARSLAREVLTAGACPSLLLFITLSREEIYVQLKPFGQADARAGVPWRYGIISAHASSQPKSNVLIFAGCVPWFSASTV